MEIKNLTITCPRCCEHATVEEDDFEIFVYNDEVFISFICPLCDEDTDNERLFF